MKNILAFTVVTLLATAGVAQTISRTAEEPLPDRFITVSDSLRVWTVFLTDPQKPSPLWVCLPQMARSVESYVPLAEAVKTWADQDTMKQVLPTMLALDLRGHGKSTIRNLDTLSFRELPQGEFAKYPTDVRDVIQTIVSDSSMQMQKDGITVIGASIGANTAALLTQSVPNIQRIVLLSPGANYHGLAPEDAIKSFKGDILLVAATGDTPSHEAAKHFHGLNPEHSTLLVYEGDAHGTNVLDSNPEAMKAVVDWLLKK